MAKRRETTIRGFGESDASHGRVLSSWDGSKLLENALNRVTGGNWLLEQNRNILVLPLDPVLSPEKLEKAKEIVAGLDRRIVEGGGQQYKDSARLISRSMMVPGNARLTEVFCIKLDVPNVLAYCGNESGKIIAFAESLAAYRKPEGKNAATGEIYFEDICLSQGLQRRK